MMTEDIIWCKQLIVADDNNQPRIMLKASDTRAEIIMFGTGTQGCSGCSIMLTTTEERSTISMFDNNGKVKAYIWVDNENNAHYYPIDEEFKDDFDEISKNIAEEVETAFNKLQEASKGL